MLRRKPQPTYRTLKLSRFRRRGRTEAEAFKAALHEANDKDHILLFVKRWYMTEVREARPHPYGAIVQQGKCYALNGTEPKKGFSDDDTRGISDTPAEGRISKAGDALVIKGRILYEGLFDSWQSHRYGVLLVLGDEYRIVVAKPFDPDRVNC